MKAALALLATLFCMEAAAQWTVVEEVNDLDSESQIVAMSPITYGEPYGASRTAIRCTSSKMLEIGRGKPPCRPKSFGIGRKAANSRDVRIRKWGSSHD